MGISAGGSGKGPKSILNVTPLVDVVLVLLVIFMVTMPVMMRNIPVTVPRDLEPIEAPIATPVLVKAMVDGTLSADKFRYYGKYRKSERRRSCSSSSKPG